MIPEYEVASQAECLFKCKSRRPGDRGISCTVRARSSSSVCMRYKVSSPRRPSHTSFQPFEPRRPYIRTPLRAEGRLAQVRHSQAIDAPSLLCSSCTYMTEQPAHLRCPDRSLSAEKKVKRKCAAIANRKLRLPALSSGTLGQTPRSHFPSHRCLPSSTLATETRTGSGARALASRNSKTLRT